MCNCKEEIEQRLAEKVSAEHRNASDIRASLEGYVFRIGEGLTRVLPAMKVVAEYRIPKAKGDGLKAAKETFHMVASYCPFCGESLKQE